MRRTGGDCETKFADFQQRKNTMEIAFGIMECHKIWSYIKSLTILWPDFDEFRSSCPRICFVVDLSKNTLFEKVHKLCSAMCKLIAGSVCTCMLRHVCCVMLWVCSIKS